MTDAEPDAPKTLRDLHYETPNGGRLRIPAYAHEIPAILRALDAADARQADEALAIPSSRLRDMIAHWLVENAVDEKRTTSQVIEGVLRRPVSSTIEPERREYQRFHHNLEHCALEVQKAGLQLCNDKNGTGQATNWWVPRRSTT